MPEGHEWHDRADTPAHGRPVLAEYHEWDNPANPTKEHVVWWWEGEYRPYPDTDGKAYVSRWRPMPGEDLTDGQKQAIIRAAEFLDSCAGADIEVDGTTAISIVEQLTVEFIPETWGDSFHVEVARLLTYGGDNAAS